MKHMIIPTRGVDGKAVIPLIPLKYACAACTTILKLTKLTYNAQGTTTVGSYLYINYYRNKRANTSVFRDFLSACGVAAA